MIRREEIVQPAPKPVLRIVIEGEAAKKLDVFLRTNVTIPEALRWKGALEQLAQFDFISREYLASNEIQVDA